MNFNEMCLGVKSSKITLDYAGHTCNDVKDLILEDHQRTIDGAAGKFDGTWNNEVSDASMREFFQKNLNYKITPEEKIFLIPETFCFHCGEKLRFVLEDNVLALRSRWIDDPNARFGVRAKNHPKEYRCPFEKPHPFCGEINVEQTLVFANFFDFPDSTEEDKYSNEWSLNAIAGRYKRAEYKCKNHNVAYGQMSNMSIGIYFNKNKNEIIVGPAYHPADFADLTDEEYEAAIKKPAFEGFKLINTISLDVWRWEATDLKTLGKENYNKLKKLGKDLVKLKVNPGIWKFEHYFDYMRRDYSNNNHIYAKLWLK